MGRFLTLTWKTVYNKKKYQVRIIFTISSPYLYLTILEKSTVLFILSQFIVLYLHNFLPYLVLRYYVAVHRGIEIG